MTLTDGNPTGTPPELRGTWLGDELLRVLTRVDGLTHALDAVQRGLALQQEAIARLSELLQTLDGRTQRHEVGQDIAREVQHQLSTVIAGLDAEAALRRDLVGRVERGDQRAQESQAELQRVLGQLATRLDAFDTRQASLAERERQLLAESAERARVDESREGRLETLERRSTAGRDSAREGDQELARLVAALPSLITRIEDLAGRIQSVQGDQRRLDEEVAALRAIRDREEALLEVLEQQRTTRARMEDRMNSVEEGMEGLRRAQAEVGEALALLARDQAGEVEQHRRLGERIEAQRDLVADHLRRSLRAEEERARRHIEEIERDVRVARGLLVRLDEQIDDAEQEQPL